MPATATVVDEHRGIAPVWHTIILLFGLVGLAVAVARSATLPFVVAYGKGTAYFWIILFECVIVGFIYFGVSHCGMSLRDLVGGNWTRPIAILRDAAISLVFLVIIFVASQVMGNLLQAEPNESVRNLIPHSSSEVILFLILTLTAGFCEEVIYRGYLQRQFSALTKSAAGGIVFQALIFGAGHTYQGWRFVLIISVVGTMFGLLAHRCRSLRPGMIAHFLQDGLGGLLARKFLA
ncbi:MAG: type II CAAX endopeptidase family protein [Candidatus Sulfotelmatobacter sp.]